MGCRGPRCRSRKRGGPSHCGLETKAFPRCPAARPLRPPSRPPRRSRCGPRSHHTAPAPSAAPGSARGPATPAATLRAAPFPQCNSPPSGPGAGLWRTPKCALLSSSRAHLASPLPYPRVPSLQPPPQPGSGLAAGLQGGVGQVSRLRAASAPAATVDAPGIGVPRHPSLAPFPMFSLRQPRPPRPQRAARGRPQARPPTETPCDGHCSRVLSFGERAGARKGRPRRAGPGGMA